MAAPQTLLNGLAITSPPHKCLFQRGYSDNQRSTTIRHAGRTAITPRRRRGQHTHGTPAALRLVRRRPQTRHRRNSQGSHPHQRHPKSHHRRRTHSVSRHHRVTDSTEPEHLFALSEEIVSRNRQMMPLHHSVRDVNARRLLRTLHQESPLQHKS